MTEFDKQTPAEGDSSLRELHKAFQRITPPGKTAADWTRMENLVIAAAAKPIPARPWFVRPFILLRPAYALTAAALALTFAGLWRFSEKLPAPLTPARLTVSAGDARVLSLGAGWMPAASARRLSAGDALSTGPSGTLAVELEPGTTLHLGKNSHVRIAALNTREIRLDLSRGFVWSTVRKRSGEEIFAVATPNGTCQVVGTKFKVEVVERPEPLPVITRLSVLTGEVRFWENASPAAYARVRAGECLALAGHRFDALAPVDKIDLLARELLSLELVLREEILPQGPELAPAILPRPQKRALPAPVEQALEVSPPAKVDAAGAALTAEADAQARELWAANFKGALKKVELKEYGTALVFLESLKEKAGVHTADRLRALEKIALCQTASGNHSQALAALEEMYGTTEAPAQRENLLWEMATLKAAHLSWFAEAERDLKVYLQAYPDGIWSEEAALKLAELQRMQGEDSSAVQTLFSFAARYPGHLHADQALYDAAFLLSQNLNDCVSAAGIYGRLTQQFPSSKFAGSAIFWRADCFTRLGRFPEARVEYNRYLTLFPQGSFREETLERLAKKD